MFSLYVLICGTVDCVANGFFNLLTNELNVYILLLIISLQDCTRKYNYIQNNHVGDVCLWVFVCDSYFFLLYSVDFVNDDWCDGGF